MYHTFSFRYLRMFCGYKETLQHNAQLWYHMSHNQFTTDLNCYSWKHTTSLRLCYNLCQKLRLQTYTPVYNCVDRPIKIGAMINSSHNFIFWKWLSYLKCIAAVGSGNLMPFLAAMERWQKQNWVSRFVILSVLGFYS